MSEEVETVPTELVYELMEAYDSLVYCAQEAGANDFNSVTAKAFRDAQEKVGAVIEAMGL